MKPLAGARQRAGLTVAQVSEQARIREAVIEGIEGGDYSACGGDFYARADIRSIAKVVGADSGPLIAEYDALYRARGPLPAVSLDELLGTSIPAAQPRRPDVSAVQGPASGGAPVRRRAGHGSAVLAELERRLGAKGCRKVNLLIEPDNEPITGFYRRHGYTEDRLIFMEKWLPPGTGNGPAGPGSAA